MFSDFFLKSFRILLLPFALVYMGIIFVRSWLYDKKHFQSVSFGLPVICVGNLSVGVTGKSPMVEYLVKNLKTGFKVATLSRGYKRKTSGYALANNDSTALEIGDEPMLFHLKFPDVPVAVGEKRIEAIPQLLHDRPDTQVIILDDAFQHRQIKPGLNILLTDYNNLFTRDFYLPAGDLRDLKSNYKRAEIIVVTKCNSGFTRENASEVITEINPQEHQKLFFTTLDYGQLYHITGKKNFILDENTEVLLVSGIANPRPLQKLLEDVCKSYSMLHYADHHIFTIDDLKDIKSKFEAIEGKNKIILSTEKDAVRLAKFKSDVYELPLYIIPIRHRFLFDGAEQFNNTVYNFIKEFKKAD